MYGSSVFHFIIGCDLWKEFFWRNVRKNGHFNRFTTKFSKLHAGAIKFRTDRKLQILRLKLSSVIIRTKHQLVRLMSPKKRGLH